jgi:isoamylase
MSWRSKEGSPLPLGASWVASDGAYNFALYSKHAETVTLLLYRAEDVVLPAYEFKLDYLQHKSGKVWHFRVARSAVPDAIYYAYLVDGPRLADCIARRLPPSEWHAFDPSKVLFDPYARNVYLPPSFDARAASLPGISNAGRAALGVLPAPGAPDPARVVERPMRDETKLVIYELHVRGFTRSDTSGVPAERRGTYAGLIDKIPYLKELGITAVELMPVFQFDEKAPDFWGYMPLSFFSAHRQYSSDPSLRGPVREFRKMVDAFHEAGIEVFLDVVYNHTGEGNHTGPTFSYKGIDNTTYYLMSGDPLVPYENFSGTGNTLHCANRMVQQLITDSLRHWTRVMDVDGFRFDEASIFTRRSDGSINLDEPPIFAHLAGAPALSRACLIAEPWDLSRGDDPRNTSRYQLGRHFPGVSWLQWNDRFRDDVRRFVKSDDGMVEALMRRLYGSDDLFPDDREHSYRPFQSVNYVTCHDGLTLCDLVSYTREEDLSWGCGHEGADGAPQAVMALRKRQAKNFACLLLLASGTPMIRAGDEFLSTQHGAGNPYADDSPRTWLDWTLLDANRDVFRFFKMMIALRNRHPVLRPARFWRNHVRWYGRCGPYDASSRQLAFYLDGAPDGDSDLYVMVNAHWEAHPFTVMEGSGWRRAVDTSLASPDDIVAPEAQRPVEGNTYLVQPRSTVVLVNASRGAGRLPPGAV